MTDITLLSTALFLIVLIVLICVSFIYVKYLNLADEINYLNRSWLILLKETVRLQKEVDELKAGQIEHPISKPVPFPVIFPQQMHPVPLVDLKITCNGDTSGDDWAVGFPPETMNMAIPEGYHIFYFTENIIFLEKNK